MPGLAPRYIYLILLTPASLILVLLGNVHLHWLGVAEQVGKPSWHLGNQVNLPCLVSVNMYVVELCRVEWETVSSLVWSLPVLTRLADNQGGSFNLSDQIGRDFSNLHNTTVMLD